MTPEISVIIPLYNTEREIRICLDSIFDSDWSCFEVIIIDDCSTDGSFAVAKQYPCRFLSTDRNSGPAKARNIGVRESRANILLFLDSDTRIKPDSIRKFHEAFLEHPEVDAVIALPEIRSLRKGRAADFHSMRTHFNYASSFHLTDYFTTQMGAMRKEAFVKAGGFNERYTGPDVEDIELGMRLPPNRILIDKSIVIEHHLPSLRIILNKFTKRAAWFTQLIKEKRMLPKTHANKKGVLSVLVVLASAISLFMSPFSSFFLFVFLMLVATFVFVNRRMFVFAAKKRGVPYFFEAVYFEYLFSMAIGIGGILSNQIIAGIEKKRCDR